MFDTGVFFPIEVLAGFGRFLADFETLYFLETAVWIIKFWWLVCAGTRDTIIGDGN